MVTWMTGGHSEDPMYSTIRANQLDYMIYLSICVCTNIQEYLIDHYDIDIACTISDWCELTPSSAYMKDNAPAVFIDTPNQGL